MSCGGEEESIFFHHFVSFMSLADMIFSFGIKIVFSLGSSLPELKASASNQVR